MQRNIPLQKNIDFNNSFEKITYINIEHDYKIYDSSIVGTFSINGKYRKTEASLIDEDFSFNVPFDIELSDLVDTNTVSLEISDFNYSIVSNNQILINVDLVLNYEEKENDRNENLETILNSLDMNELDDDCEDEKQEEDEQTIPKDNEGVIEVSEENLDVITGFISDKKDYVTYKVHILREGEDINLISNKYNVPINVLLEYNNESESKTGDKIIIPYVFE